MSENLPPPAGAQPPPPPYPSGPESGSAAAGGGRAETKGFLGALFDFGFTTFVTPKVVKFAYIIAMALVGLGLLVFVVGALTSGEVGLILVALFIAPLVALLYLVIIRMSFEFFVAVVRMSEDVHRRLPGV